MRLDLSELLQRMHKSAIKLNHFGLNAEQTSPVRFFQISISPMISEILGILLYYE